MEMGVDSSVGVLNAQTMPFTLMNKQETESRIQHYFSSFYKEMLWPSSNIIVYELVLPYNVGIQLDLKKLFPTVIMHQDKRSKCSVAELLQTVVTLSLGKKSIDLCFNKHLFSVLFEIGCESSDAVGKLLQQFIMQIAHYLSFKSMLDVRVPVEFLEVLFQCINCESDCMIKDFVSMCFKGFLECLLKLLSKPDRQNSVIYHYTIHKMINLALYPSHDEPLTAAFAFNHLYSLCISPNLNMIAPNKYWLEFLHSFLVSLEKCNEIQVNNALTHIKNTIISRTSIFNAKFPSRRKPIEFPNEKLEGAVTWLFEQCGNVSPLLRCTCMDLFEDLCVHVSNIKTTKDFVDKYGVENVNKVALRGLNDFEQLDLDNLKAFTRTLDFYTWIFNRKMSTPEILLVSDKSEKETVTCLNVLENFISILISNNVEDSVGATALCAIEAKQILELIRAIVFKILNFVAAIIAAENFKNVIKNTWNDNLCLLLSRLALCPWKVGFPKQSLDDAEYKTLENLLTIALKHLPRAYLTKFQKNFFIDMQEEFSNFSNVQFVIASKSDLSNLHCFVIGIIRLKKCEFINFEKQFKFTFAHIKERITGISEVLQSTAVNSHSKENIDPCVIEYLNEVLKFLLYSYKFELAEFIINLISSEYSSANGTAATTFFDAFKQTILEFFMKDPLNTLNILNKILLSSPEKLLLLLESLLVHAISNPHDNSKILADSIIKDCSCYKDLILDIQYHDWLFKINRLAVSMSNDPTIANEGLPHPLISYILEEFDKAECTSKRIDIVDGFLRCFIDGSGASKPNIAIVFGKLKKQRLESAQQLNALVKKLVVIKSWNVWEGTISMSCGACADIFQDIDLTKHLEALFRGMSSEDASKTIESMYIIFKDLNLTPEERLDVLNYFLLLSVECCYDVVALVKFYNDNFQEFYNLIIGEMHESDVLTRKHSLISKIACYQLFEIMYGKLPAEVSLGFLIECSESESHAEYLNISLLRLSLEMRSFVAQFDEEKKLTRLLICSALNTYIARMSLPVDNTFQNLMFKEEALENQLIWEKIVETDRRYEFSDASTSLQVQVVNVISKNGDRTRLSLENDELNGHECMAMIVAIFLHLHDCKPAQTKDTLPEWMVNFHEAFAIRKDNVILFLLRVIVNASRVFVPWMHLLFESIAKVMCFYLRENEMNYLIRDVLMLILEAKCELSSESEIEVGQKLMEALMQQAQNTNISICEYNVELIEKLMSLWKSKLQVPANLDTLLQSDQVFSIRIILVLLKNDALREGVAYKNEVQVLIKKRMFKWREPLMTQIVEILGYMISCTPEEERDRMIKKSLVPMFKEMKRAGSADFCERMFYSIYKILPRLVKHEDLLTFINPVDLENDDCRAECFEIFLTTMMDLDPSIVFARLESMQFMNLLREKTLLPCVEVGFRIIDKLVLIFDAQQLLPYASVVKEYARQDALWEHRSNAIWFFVGIYKNYINILPEARDENVKRLITLSEQVLINSVSDPSDEMQEEVLDFWRDSSQLTENTVDRLERILAMFSLEVHSSYAQFLCLLMLDLTNKYSDNQKLLFSPLTPSSFENQESIVTRKSRSKTLTQRPASAQKSKSPTNVEDTPRQRIDNADMNLSKRTFLSNDEIDQQDFLYPSVTRNYAEDYEEKLTAQKLEQENFMKFNRTYKETYLPDVEINQADVVATIEDYVKRCPSYAADLSVSIVHGILENFKDTEMFYGILESLKSMCQKALKAPNDFAPTAMKILYTCDCPYEADDLLRIAKCMDLQPLGILVLEKKSMFYNYGELYRTGKKVATRLDHNVHLASLYRSIDEHDVVESIFKNWRLDAAFDYLCEASTTEAEMDWMNANEYYMEGFKAAGGVVKDYCMEGMFECLSKLSSWTEINRTIDSFINDGDYNSIWQHPNKDELLPWMFKAQLQEKLENLICARNSESQFSNYLEAWVNEKRDSVTRLFGEELSMFFLCNGDSSTAQKCLESLLCDMNKKCTLEESNERVRNKFKRINEINMYIKAVDKDPIDGAKELMDFWNKNLPEFGDDLVNWNIQLNYRLTFSNLFSNWLQDVSMDAGTSNELIETGLKQRLAVDDLALKYKNLTIARKLSLQIKRELGNIDSEDEFFRKLRHQFKLASSRYAHLHSKIETDVDRRFSHFVTSWCGARQLLLPEEHDRSMAVKICHHVFDVTRDLRLATLDNDSIAYRIWEDDDFIKEELQFESQDNIYALLFDYSFNTLKEVCLEGSDQERADSYTKFAEYCYKLMSDAYDRNNGLHTEFLISLLQAMSFGSVKATRYFPCLLKHSIYRNSEFLTKQFLEKCQNIPTRLFLDWQEEIISHLETPLSSLVWPIVEKLCNDFPSAIAISLQKARANPAAEELYRSTFQHQKQDSFFTAIEYLCQPEEYLRHRLQEFINSLDNKKNLSESINLMMKKVDANDTLQSAELKKVYTSYKNDFEGFASISDVLDARKAAEVLCKSLQKTMAQRIERTELTELTKLAYYSPFLNDFTRGNFNIDVPIQHNALLQRPKIVRIDRFVRIISSKSNSLAIKIIGSDGKSYEFLVNCGLDMRQDKKMQTILKMANQSLQDNMHCFKRQLSVCTYSVNPISMSTGLVQLIPNVKSLEEIVCYSLTDKSTIQNVKDKYEEWIYAASIVETDDESLAYNRSFAKYSAANVSEKMIELSTAITPNLIQQTFLQISPSLDSYFKLRQNFIKSYATMCLIHWLFGVGDRRLKNILVDICNGDCYGINFALVLGAAAQLPIPELVPFRLTAQIINLMKPFNERDLFGATMTHVLKALKKKSDLIVGCLEAFVREPINWNAKLNILWKNYDQIPSSVEFSPTRTIDILKRKLSGSKPSTIFTDEISYVHNQSENQYFPLCQLVVNGNERYHCTARSLMKNNELTPEEQVRCLLDQATDVNTIGRMWAEWKSFL